ATNAPDAQGTPFDDAVASLGGSLAPLYTATTFPFDIHASLNRLAVAIELAPGGPPSSDRAAADRIRRDVANAPLLVDDQARATKDALATAAKALDAITANAYAQDPMLTGKTPQLSDTVVTRSRPNDEPP